MRLRVPRAEGRILRGGSILVNTTGSIISRRVFQNLSFDRLDRAACRFHASEVHSRRRRAIVLFSRGWKSLLPSRSYAESRSREDSPTHFLNPSNRLCIARYNRYFQECFAKQSYAAVKSSCPHSFAHRSLAKPSRAATVRFLRGS